MEATETIYPSPGFIRRSDRENLHGHRGKVLWFTGLSGAGKSTLAALVERELNHRGCSTYLLDGDNIRLGLCGDLGFSAADRSENIRRIGHVASLFLDAGVVVLAAFISPYQRDRAWLRSQLPEGDFIEVFVNCPLEECCRRDVKGIYRKALAGEIKHFTGVSAPYEAPLDPEISIRTDLTGKEDACREIVEYLAANGFAPDYAHQSFRAQDAADGLTLMGTRNIK
jgi:adenylylsulfate kinase